MRLDPRSGARRGASTVEMAVAAPLVVLFFFGMVELGRGYLVLQVATNAAREGARFAVLGDRRPTVDEVKQRISDYLANLDSAFVRVPAAAIQSISVTTDQDGSAISVTDLQALKQFQPVRVQLDVDYSKVAWLAKLRFVAASTKLRGTVVMRKEP